MSNGTSSSMLLGTSCATVLLAAFAAGCAAGGADDADAGAGAAIPKAGSYSGIYEVPTRPELAAAATYDVADVEWSVRGGEVELSYDLPLGLVGTKVRVKFAGNVDSSGAKASLAGDAGTADCNVGGGSIVCFETMRGLLPLEVDLAEVEARARAEYAGPLEHRLDVAKQFASDPIGIVDVDLTSVDAGETEIEHPEDD
jgi:hypothetical protein